jgi:hypothetical protein
MKQGHRLFVADYLFDKRLKVTMLRCKGEMWVPFNLLHQSLMPRIESA